MRAKFTLRFKPLILLVISVSLLFSLTIWFSANAIISQLVDLWALDDYDLALLSMILIIGFVIGGIFSAIFNLPDIIKTENFFFLFGSLGALTNFLAINSPAFFWFLIYRFFTGFFLAGVYPTAMKLMSSWYKKNRGLAIGVLLGALTAGSGLPYLFNIFGAPEWRILMSISSLLCFIGAIFILLFIKEGPFISHGAKFKITNMGHIWSKKSVVLANIAYFGHMWELYAFWIWIPTFLIESYSLAFPTEDPLIFSSLGTFIIFISGAIGNALGGIVSDKIGRTWFTMLMLMGSGLSSILIGFFFNSPVISLIISIIWGATVVPDSPQYSVMITELTDQDYIGTALTMQTTIGFGLTLVSIRLLPSFVNLVSWNYGFIMLIFGPILGILALILLRKQPDSFKLGQGKK